MNSNEGQSTATADSVKDFLNYRREKTVDIDWTDDGLMNARGHLSDTYHEMKVRMKFSYPDLTIREAEAEMIRHPHAECLPGRFNIAKVIGTRVEKGLYTRLEEIMGGSEGCTHITNLVHEICYSAVQASFLKGRDDMDKAFGHQSRERRLKTFFKFKPRMRNSCAALSDNSPFVQAADALPEE